MHWWCWSLPHWNWVWSPLLISSRLLSDLDLSCSRFMSLQPDCEPPHLGRRLQYDMANLQVRILRRTQSVALEPAIIFGDSFEVDHVQVSPSVDFPVMCVFSSVKQWYILTYYRFHCYPIDLLCRYRYPEPGSEWPEDNWLDLWYGPFCSWSLV